MYLAHFGFRDKPFSIVPDPAFMYFGRSHSAAAALLEFAISERPGISVVTGEIGTGKTTLIRHLIARLGSQAVVGLVSNTHPHFGPLLGRILHAYGIEMAGQTPLAMLEQLELFLEEQNRYGKRAILAIDEAQALDVDTLEELRMLSNTGADSQMLQVVLVGQPGLRDTLRAPALLQFAQRVVADYHLEPLDRSETERYIRHRQRCVSDVDSGVFDTAACDAIYDYTRGVPRLINILCEDALMFSYLNRQASVGEAVVHQMADDRLRGAILPLFGVLARFDGERAAPAL